jgi:hypothetical protein
MKMAGGPAEEGPGSASLSPSSFGSFHFSLFYFILPPNALFASMSSCTCTLFSSFFHATRCFIWFLLLDCLLSLSYLFFLPLHYFVAWGIEAVSFSKMLVMNYRSTLCYVPENCNFEVNTDVNICLK